MTAPEHLKAVCDSVVADPSLAPHDGKTFCNVASRKIAEGMGYFGITSNMLANDLILFLASAPGWAEGTLASAHAYALNGGLAFIALSEAPHGHIAAVYPAPMQESGTWGGPVPMLANVGRTIGVMKLSAVFKVADKEKLRAFVYG